LAGGDVRHKANREKISTAATEITRRYSYQKMREFGQKRNMPNNDYKLSLDELAVFLAVTESGGFRSAAKRMGISPSTVSDKLAALETSLGVPLLVRTTRSMRPTDAGLMLAARLSPLLNEARMALQEVANSRHEVSGRLKLNVPGAVMVDILPPIIDRFLQTYPNVQVEISVDDRFVDIVASGCDAGIRYGEHLTQNMIAVPIGPRIQRAAMAASPAYLKVHGIPVDPADLLHHACIRMRFSSGALAGWLLAHEDQSLTIDPAARIVVNESAATSGIEFARQGHGIVYAFENWLAPWFKSGELVPVLPAWWPSFEGPRLYYSSRLTLSPLRAFVDVLKEQRYGAEQG
jgi:DNA-binding transcriptional LysR family regulator